MKRKPSPPPEAETAAPSADPGASSLRHIRIGWWVLLVFLTLGIGLEALHGVKAGFYLDVGNDVRRLMWRLAHAHGTFLGLVQIAYGLTLRLGPVWSAGRQRLAGFCLNGATALIPLGFFTGGLTLYGGDPGFGILLLPLGALLLLIAVGLTALALGGRASSER